MKRMPQEFGEWFHALGEGTMKQTSLLIFYQLGKAIESLGWEVQPGLNMGWWKAVVWNPAHWLKKFIDETGSLPMPDSRAAAQKFIDLADELTPTVERPESTMEDLVRLTGAREDFEKAFEREHHNIDVFTVLPKGIYDTRKLLENPEKKFPASVEKAFTQQIIYDLKQAGRCLAFELPTACAFHICRATEALIVQYYESLAVLPWSHRRRDWAMYIDHLEKHKATPAITQRLDEIRKLDRNAYTHPEKNVELEDAPVVFELCTGVIFQMAKEIAAKMP